MVEVVRVSGQDIAYRGSEGGGVPVLFVHGNSSSSRTWHHLLDGPFGQRHRCLALDLPGHGASPAAEAGSGVYSLPGYAAILAEFVTATDARGAVVVGWSLGGHIALEAAAALPDAAGFVIFGTPPVRTVEDMPAAFLPNPAVQIGFAADVDADAALAYATSFLAPGATLPTGELVEDILATDGTARSDFYASLATMPLADEVEVVEKLARPLAILHGDGEQLISLDYLRKLNAPTLWRGEVQVIAGAGHAPQEENPAEFAALLDQFIADLPA
ncbi:alpha/beta hydrolase [Actinophytocola sp.]|uniref:alpha/beta fold hydrolase n=1 Tax=Actinophytocola sp. TaxID=1872138 RepID=UPI002D381B36|nr:alpha/beta hydrolase [Actinophytocola sp.]HYQ62923.1 alpha/beta hydrolase [Actinophytocola sp.]